MRDRFSVEMEYRALEVYDAAALVSWSFSFLLTFSIWSLAHRYPSLGRLYAEHALAASWCLRAAFRSTPRSEQLWTIGQGASWLLIWAWRCDERRLAFAIRGRRRVVAIAILAVAQAGVAIGGYLLSIGAFELIATCSFATAWACAVALAYSLERDAPRPHREREAVATVGALCAVDACASPFLGSGPALLSAAAVQALIAARLLGAPLRRALAGKDGSSLFEAIYESGGELRGPGEALLTPLREPFLDYCDEFDSVAVGAYREAADRERGAAVESDGPSSRAAARGLSRYWNGFADRRDGLQTDRREYTIDDSDGSSSETWDE